MGERTAELLQHVIRRTGRSLLQYVAEAAPWAPTSDRETLAQVRQLIEEEREALAALSRFLRKRRVVPPYLGPYPEHFTTLNYLSLGRLLALLLEQQSQAVADLEADLTRVADPEAHHELERLLEVKRRHLAVLSELKTAAPHASTRV